MNKYLAEIMDCKANEYGYSADVFLSKNHIKYTIDENSVFNMITFGTSTVISGSQKIIDQIKKELDGIKSIELFDAPSLFLIDSVLHENSHKLSEICDFFIPSETIAEYGIKRDCPFVVKKVGKEDIFKIDDVEIYDNALCQGEASSLNEMAYIALDSGKIVSIAGASSNTKKMWWIGVDTESDYRRKGLASLLVNRVACDVIEMGRIPVYPTWYANIASRITAIKAGFVPGFIEIGSQQVEQ